MKHWQYVSQDSHTLVYFHRHLVAPFLDITSQLFLPRSKMLQNLHASIINENKSRNHLEIFVRDSHFNNNGT